MPDRNPETLAGAMLSTVQLALARELPPVHERLKAVETHQLILGDVRDRVISLEERHKAVQLPPVPAVDARAVLDAAANQWQAAMATMANGYNTRLAVLEETISVLRERQAHAEVATVAPGPVVLDTSALDGRIAALGERVAVAELAVRQAAGLRETIEDLRERVVVGEMKAQTPVVVPADLTDRVIALEARASTVDAWSGGTAAALQDLRERVAIGETKDLQVPVQPVDLTERVVALETRLATTDALHIGTDKVVDALQERLVTVERKDPATLAADIHAKLVTTHERLAVVEVTVQGAISADRLAALDAKVDGALRQLDDLPRVDVVRDLTQRVVAMEVRPVPGPDAAVTDLRERLVGVESSVVTLRERIDTVKDVALQDALRLQGDAATVQRDTAAIVNRLVAVETRGAIPGPPGPAGQNGLDGKAGTDGCDGVGFDDLSVVQVDDRTVTLRAARGDRVKDIGTVTIPFNLYRGKWMEGGTYERGDCVTWDGSEWHCDAPTAKKPGVLDGAKDWTLKVKRGKDGRDGKDGGAGPKPTEPVRPFGTR